MKERTSGTSALGRKKDPEKRAAILEAASRIFLERGYQGTSMDAVANEASVSKQTVYSGFKNKEGLFSACIADKIASYGFDTPSFDRAEDAATVVTNMMRRFVDLILDPDVIAMYRTVLAECTTLPQISELFFTNGPALTRTALHDVIAQIATSGALAIPDTDYATWQLLNMAYGGFHAPVLFNLNEAPSADARERHARRIVEDFFRLYAPASADRSAGA